jgi:hypothetical protein
MKRLLLLGAASFVLAACGDKPQTIGQNNRHDTAASQGTGKPYQVQGWKAGDASSWEQQLKVRAQAQNDYARTN